ncbi:MAG: hypothetical protein JNJ49_05130 [Bdellovibrionaceae bacterium]|nr:hypothetical protein [Pseudobdellovibrionaceae bacterium]
MRLFLREYFFSPSSALPLGLTRVALYTGILVFYGVFIGDFSQFAAGASSLTWRPVGLFPDGILWLFDGPVGPGMLDWLFKTSVLLALIGWKFRWTSIVALVSSVLLFGFISSSGNAFRVDTILIQAQLIACLAPMSAALSLDAGFKLPVRSGDYRWPLVLFQMHWVFIFMASGLGKLRQSGFAWAYDNFFREYLFQTYVTRGPQIEGNWTEWLIRWLMEHSEVTLIGGAIVFGFELLYPLIFVRRLTLPFLALSLFFQIAVRLALGISFFAYWMLLPMWLPHIFHERAIDEFYTNMIGRLKVRAED